MFYEDDSDSFYEQMLIDEDMWLAELAIEDEAYELFIIPTYFADLELSLNH